MLSDSHDHRMSQRSNAFARLLLFECFSRVVHGDELKVRGSSDYVIHNVIARKFDN